MSYDPVAHMKAVLRANENAKHPLYSDVDRKKAADSWAAVPVNSKALKEAKKKNWYDAVSDDHLPHKSYHEAEAARMAGKGSHDPHYENSKKNK